MKPDLVLPASGLQSQTRRVGYLPSQRNYDQIVIGPEMKGKNIFFIGKLA